MIRAWPSNPTGYWNMSWLFSQATEQEDHLAKAHAWLVRCLEVADAAEHDIVKCVACIELAASIIFGAGRPYHTATWSVAEVSALLARFDAGTAALDAWGMGAYSRGECSSDEVVRHYVGAARKAGVSTARCENSAALFTQDTGSPSHVGTGPIAVGTCSGCRAGFAQTSLKRCSRCKDPNVQ